MRDHARALGRRDAPRLPLHRSGVARLRQPVDESGDRAMYSPKKYNSDARTPWHTGLRGLLLGFTALVAPACGSSGENSDAATECGSYGQCTISSTGISTAATTATTATTVTSTGTESGPATCEACGAAQVCIGGECTDVPDSCPCPVETYCDLIMNKCVIGCTKDEECDVGRICDPVARVCFAGCREDVDCGAGQICEGLTCIEGCRKDEECGANEICDGLTCQIGCNTTSDCPRGQICDGMVCRDGCVSDGECTAPGQICDDTAKVCRAGCRTDEACPLEKLCDTQPDAYVCVPGCDGIDKCGPGKICKAGQCTVGCLDNSWCSQGEICKQDICTIGCVNNSDCGPGEICDPDVCVTGCASHDGCDIEEYCFEKKCVPGCGPPGGTKDDGLTSRCPPGKACSPSNCEDGQNCDSYGCSTYCNGWECASGPGESYTCYGANPYKYCMMECATDADCPPGKLCMMHADPPESYNYENIGLCRTPCAGGSGCANMWFNWMGASCTCQMQGSFAGKCTYKFNDVDYECTFKKSEMP